MQFFGYKDGWINPNHIVSVSPPKCGEKGQLVLSDGRVIPIGVLDFSELKARFDLHVVFRIYG